MDRIRHTKHSVLSMAPLWSNRNFEQMRVQEKIQKFHKFSSFLLFLKKGEKSRDVFFASAGLRARILSILSANSSGNEFFCKLPFDTLIENFFSALEIFWWRDPLLSSHRQISSVAVASRMCISPKKSHRPFFHIRGCRITPCFYQCDCLFLLRFYNEFNGYESDVVNCAKKTARKKREHVFPVKEKKFSTSAR
jgi:hypothetical protein